MVVIAPGSFLGDGVLTLNRGRRDSFDRALLVLRGDDSFKLLAAVRELVFTLKSQLNLKV